MGRAVNHYLDDVAELAKEFLGKENVSCWYDVFGDQGQCFDWGYIRKIDKEYENFMIKNQEEPCCNK